MAEKETVSNPYIDRQTLVGSGVETAVQENLDRLLDYYTTPKRLSAGRGRGGVLPVGSAIGTAAVKKAAEVVMAVETRPLARALSTFVVGAGGGVAATAGLELAVGVAPVAITIPGVALAAAASAGSTLLVSALERALGENAFQLFAKYSHTEGVGKNRLVKTAKLVSPPVGYGLEGLGKSYQLFTRALERAALKSIVTPVAPSRKARKLVALSENPSIPYNKKNLKLVGEGFYYLLTTGAVEKYGAYLSPQEQAVVRSNRALISRALDKVMRNESFGGQTDLDTILTQVEKAVRRAERLRYSAGIGAVVGIEAAKGALIYQLIEEVVKLVSKVKDGIYPFLPGRKLNQENLNLRPQPEAVPVTVTKPVEVTQPQLNPQPFPSPVTVGQPHSAPDVIPVPVMAHATAAKPLETATDMLVDAERITSPRPVTSTMPAPVVPRPVAPVAVNPAKPLTVVPVVPMTAENGGLTATKVAGAQTLATLSPELIEPATRLSQVVTAMSPAEINQLTTWLGPELGGALTHAIQAEGTQRAAEDIRAMSTALENLQPELGAAVITAVQSGAPQLIQSLEGMDPKTAIQLICSAIWFSRTGQWLPVTP
ncbi:hypothetical protein M1523_02040 [Patescibacteria group bacterium]|nr:hypothetical protein [Patescibacteria group bacterium]MCL5091992.1 hypothetical protein [Patescibacteria group bacterium]